MIEAVNSVLQAAPFVRAHAEQTSVADSFAANPDRVQKAPQVLAPYISPYIHLDVNYDKAVIQLRNGETGDVEGQFPSEAALEQAARHNAAEQAAREAAARTVTSGPGPASGGGETKLQGEGALTFVQSSSDAPAPRTSAPTPQQQAAFTSAVKAGNSNAGNVTLFA